MIKFISFPVHNSLLTTELLRIYISKFWTSVYHPLHQANNNIHLLLLCKVQFTDSSLGYRTVANLRKVNFADKAIFTQYLTAKLGILSQTYKVNDIEKIVFTYIIREGLADGSRMLLQEPKFEVVSHSYNNIPLPLTMDPLQYGELLGQMAIENGSRFILDNENTMFIIESIGNVNTCVAKGPKNLKWTDTLLDNNIIERVIEKDTLYIKDGVIIVQSKNVNAKPFNTAKTDKKLMNINKFMTFDIETINIDGTLKPYLICGYNKNNEIVSYAMDMDDVSIQFMFINFIDKLMNIKHLKYIYAHNLSGFDGILLLQHLISYPNSKVEPLLHNGKIISIRFNIINEIINKNGNKEMKIVKTLIFKDSLLLLPLSLRKLCAAFNVDNVKGYFPVLFNNINYTGALPHIKYWPDIDRDQYNDLENHYKDSWSFKDEAIKYCLLDCKSLFEVLIKFNELVFKEFKINIHGSLTLPSLAMNIYKSSFMPKDVIYQLAGPIEDAIRKAYTGGAVDVFIPHNVDFNTEQCKKLYYYDVNSLYPYIMSTLEMPVGKPIAFEGKVEPYFI
jgi:DNA polymerase type B, organellar and viral